MKNGSRRIYFLDELRGFAIICMVIHHMFYDIGFMLGIDFGYKVFDFLCVFQPIFWSIFILTSGICSRLSRNAVKRGLIVFSAGIIITISTAVVMPKIFKITGAEIYFGILSCLGLCMIITGLAMPLIKKVKVIPGLCTAAFLFALTYSIQNGSLLFGLIKLPSALYSGNILMPLGFYDSSFHSADYFPLLPWLFMFLFGAFLGGYAVSGDFPETLYKRRSGALCFIGKNSLWIYIFHQPVLYLLMEAAACIIAFTA